MNRVSLKWIVELAGAIGWFVLGNAALAADADRAAAPVYYGTAQQLASLENRDVSESSGLAVSRRQPNLFWTHNDSGDKPRLFCFDRQGKHRGTCRLKKANAVDWEDMCSFVDHGKPMLMVADVGDNTGRRKKCRLYLFEEPRDPGDDIGKSKYRTLAVRYDTGPTDCEAIGVDTEQRKIIFISKYIGLTSTVYEADLPGPDDGDQVLAKKIATIRVPIVTAMDISPDGRRAIVATLGQAFQYHRAAGETWQEVFARKPQKVNVPPRRQGEAICYGPLGRDLYLTSEMLPTPLFRVPAK